MAGLLISPYGTAPGDTQTATLAQVFGAPRDPAPPVRADLSGALADPNIPRGSPLASLAGPAPQVNPNPTTWAQAIPAGPVAPMVSRSGGVIETPRQLMVGDTAAQNPRLGGAQSPADYPTLGGLMRATVPVAAAGAGLLAGGPAGAMLGYHMAGGGQQAAAAPTPAGAAPAVAVDPVTKSLGLYNSFDQRNGAAPTLQSAVPTGAQHITPEQATIQRAVLNAGPNAADSVLAKELSRAGIAAQQPVAGAVAPAAPAAPQTYQQQLEASINKLHLNDLPKIMSLFTEGTKVQPDLQYMGGLHDQLILNSRPVKGGTAAENDQRRQQALQAMISDLRLRSSTAVDAGQQQALLAAQAAQGTVP